MNIETALYCPAGGYATTAATAPRRGEASPRRFSSGRARNIAVAMLVGAVLALTAACVPNAYIHPSGSPKVVDATDQAADADTAAAAAAVRSAAEAPAEAQPAIAHAIDREQRIIAADDPRALAQQAEEVPAAQAISLLLRAIAGYIELNQLDAAQTLAEETRAKQMTARQRQTLQRYEVQLAQAQNNHEHAIELLRRLEESSPSADADAELLLMLANSQQALRRHGAAVETLLRRDELLEQAERIANQQRILTLLGSLDSLALSLLRENPVNNSIDGWVALRETLSIDPLAQRIAAIQRWRTRYGGHPAELVLTQRLLAGSSTHYRHIAVLLPLTSPFGRDAQAFYEGFMAARDEDFTAYRASVSLHDIGEEPALAAAYYRTAVAAGADFVVGPLGRRAVGALLAAAPPELPTLVIGTIPQEKSAPNLYGISLSPEQEASQAAARAFADGHRQAGIFASDSEWGRRVASAFAAEWEARGGTLVDRATFPRNIAEHAQVIRKLLGLNESIARARILEARLGVDMQFTPRRRDDLDFLFLAANAQQARLLAPQIRFFQAHDLAMYATSTVYSGKPDPATDADLDGIIFGDMSWMLEAAIVAQTEAVSGEGEGEGEGAAMQSPVALPTATANGRASSPYHHTERDRLYALGLESYRLIPALDTLRNNRWRRYSGAAMDISVQADGNALRHLAWARFEQGLPRPLSAPGDLSTRVLDLESDLDLDR